jgi:hypothetical protein
MSFRNCPARIYGSPSRLASRPSSSGPSAGRRIANIHFPATDTKKQTERSAIKSEATAHCIIVLLASVNTKQKRAMNWKLGDEGEIKKIVEEQSISMVS